MRVAKFGGTSVGDGERIGAVARLVASRKETTPFVVVSAMSGITDLLLSLSSSALKRDRTGADEALRRYGERHRSAVDTLGLPEDEAGALRDEVGRELVRLSDLATGVSLLSELSPRTADAVAASGEILSSHLLAAALRKAGADAVRLDPRALMATDASHGAALPDIEETARRVRRHAVPALAGGRVVVTGGFVGAAPDGATTTLGRGGSDTSAAVFGAALADAGCAVDAIEIWTDVDGILTADPRICPAARLVPEVSYAEASELAFFGAKVLHPATIKPAVARGIPVVVKNTFRPDVDGTVVRADAPGAGVRALAMRRNVAAFFIGSPRMLLAHGYAAKVFAVFERHLVPVDVIATSEVSISVTVDESAPLEALRKDLGELADVAVMRGLAVVSVVGKGLRATPRVAARVFSALGDRNVILISQGASDTNLTFVVDGSDGPEALRRLHRELFEGGAS